MGNSDVSDTGTKRGDTAKWVTTPHIATFKEAIMDCRRCKPKKVRMRRLVKGFLFRCPECGFEVNRSTTRYKVTFPGRG